MRSNINNGDVFSFADVGLTICIFQGKPNSVQPLDKCRNDPDFFERSSNFLPQKFFAIKSIAEKGIRIPKIKKANAGF